MSGDLNRARHCWSVAPLRGREAVRADPRLRADDEPIRTQSRILYRTPRASSMLTVTVFLIRMVFIRIKNTVGARSAQFLLLHTTPF